MKRLFLPSILLFSFIILLIGCRDGIDGGDSSASVAEPYYSEYPFHIIAPVFKDKWDTGTTHTILWESYENITHVNLFLYKKSELKGTIAVNLENTGSYIWTVPQVEPFSHHYSIRIVNKNYYPQYIDSEQFYILQ